MNKKHVTTMNKIKPDIWAAIDTGIVRIVDFINGHPFAITKFSCEGSDLVKRSIYVMFYCTNVSDLSNILDYFCFDQDPGEPKIEVYPRNEFHEFPQYRIEWKNKSSLEKSIQNTYYLYSVNPFKRFILKNPIPLKTDR